MKRVRLVVVTAVCILFVAVPAFACLWDYDTLAVERQQFPTVLELITGKFLRHSKEFYEWRIQDRTKRLQAEPDNVALYDDLAVAYHKVGQNDKAIETMLEKEKRHPGLYETYSNLGTFYIFTGELEKAVAQISKAIEINPDAHFGREVYQKLLVEYILGKKEHRDSNGKIVVPLLKERDAAPASPSGFAAFLKRKMKRLGENAISDDLPPEERSRALNGVLGMMRFANHDSPLLLEALGDLLLSPNEEGQLQYGDAKLLAARAYLMASYSAQDMTARQEYRAFTDRILSFQAAQKGSHTGIGLENLEHQFQEELNEAQDWYAQVRADELAWIQAGADVDGEFSRKYYQDPTLSTASGLGPAGGKIVMFLVLPIVAYIALVWYLRSRRRKRKLQSPNGVAHDERPV